MQWSSIDKIRQNDVYPFDDYPLYIKNGCNNVYEIPAIRKYAKPHFITVPEISGDNLVILNANSFVETQFLTNKSDTIEIRELLFVGDNGNYLIEMKHTQFSRYLQNKPIHAVALADAGILACPLVISEGHSLEFKFFDVGGLGNAIRPVGRAVSYEHEIYKKYWQDECEKKAGAKVDYRDVSPFFYTTDTIVVLPNNTTSIVFAKIKIDGCADFWFDRFTAFSDFPFKVRARSTTKSHLFTSGWIHVNALIGGGTNFYNRWPSQLLERGEEIQFEFQNLTANVNNVFICLSGTNMYVPVK